MVDLVSRTRRDGGVTLVEAALVNDRPGPRRVRVEPRVEPVWPPRRRGRPAPGWDGGRYAVTLAAGERHGFGFATPADPAEPAVVLAADRSPDEERSGGADPRPAEVVRELGDPVPPRDAVRAVELPGETGPGSDGRGDPGSEDQRGSGRADPGSDDEWGSGRAEPESGERRSGRTDPRSDDERGTGRREPRPGRTGPDRGDRGWWS